MARTGPRRPMAAFKALQEEIDGFDRQAAAEGLFKANGEPNRSDLIRLLVEYARQHMPPGWRPEPPPDKHHK